MKPDPTINPREIIYYERLAESWWNTESPFWPLHIFNELRAAYIRDKLCQHFGLNAKAEKPLTGLHVLDVGCGGVLSESMALLGALVTGIDVVDKNIRIASLHAQQQGL